MQTAITILENDPALWTNRYHIFETLILLFEPWLKQGGSVMCNGT